MTNVKVTVKRNLEFFLSRDAELTYALPEATRKCSYTFPILFSGRGGKKGAVECCPNCRGTGMQIRIHQIGPGMVQQIQSVCMECQGHGERISPKDRCKSCTGRKIVREKKILEVHIDKGEASW